MDTIKGRSRAAVRDEIADWLKQEAKRSFVEARACSERTRLYNEKCAVGEALNRLSQKLRLAEFL